MNKSRWFYLIIGILVMLMAGVIYTWTILKAPVAEEFGFPATALSVNYTLTFSFFCIGSMLTGVFKKKIGFRKLQILAAVIVVAGFVTASRLTSIGMLYFGYGILGGLGIGMIYNSIISELSAWFADRQGLCSGALMMGFGASAMILGGLIEKFIVHPGIGWRMTYAFIGIAIFAVTIISAIVIKTCGEKSITAGSERREADKIDIPTKDMVRKISFWSVFFRGICMGSAGSVVINCARELSLSLGASVALATSMVGILSICNGLGRLIFGFLYDVLKYKKTLWLANILAIIAMLVNIAAVWKTSIQLLILGAIILGISYGSSTTMSSAIVSDFYGAKYFSQNFSIMNITLFVSSFVVTLCSVILEAAGGYMVPFIVLLAMMIAGCFLTIFIKKPAQ